MIHVDWQLKKQGSLEKTRLPVKLCPRCDSIDMFWAQGIPQFWSLWQCRNCGYREALILEDGNHAAKLQEEWKDKSTH
ncbi:MAG: hypothetical protein R3319_04140 [Candidatus Bathyarchaeia archaeon]|nr:hypothetical protein [Candidatus Bathyarchaeia archaeon]